MGGGLFCLNLIMQVEFHPYLQQESLCELCRWVEDHVVIAARRDPTQALGIEAPYYLKPLGDH